MTEVRHVLLREIELCASRNVFERLAGENTTIVTVLLRWVSLRMHVQHSNSVNTKEWQYLHVVVNPTSEIERLLFLVFMFIIEVRPERLNLDLTPRLCEVR